MIAIYLTLRQLRRLAETRGGVSRGDIAEALESSREGDDRHNPLAAEDVWAVGELYDKLKTGQGLRPLAKRLKQVGGRPQAASIWRGDAFVCVFRVYVVRRGSRVCR